LWPRGGGCIKLEGSLGGAKGLAEESMKKSGTSKLDMILSLTSSTSCFSCLILNVPGSCLICTGCTEPVPGSFFISFFSVLGMVKLDFLFQDGNGTVLPGIS